MILNLGKIEKKKNKLWVNIIDLILLNYIYADELSALKETSCGTAV